MSGPQQKAFDVMGRIAYTGVIATGEDGLGFIETETDYFKSANDHRLPCGLLCGVPDGPEVTTDRLYFEQDMTTCQA
jgi:hypothetical protein